MKSERITLFGLFMWLLALLFFFYEFFLRILLGTIASDVIFQLHLSAGQFSVIAAGYYITYGVMQVPVGILTEKVGARITLSVACLFCVFGVVLLSLAHGFALAFISRLLIGFGSSFGFVSLMLVSLKWFPRKYFSLMTGLSIFLGAIGPLLAGAPLAYVYKAVDGNWRGILVCLGLFGLLLSVLLLLFIRNEPKESEKQLIFLSPNREKLRSLVVQLLNLRQCWMVLLYTSATYLILPIFAAYFGTLLLQARGLSLMQAALIISIEWIGYAVGSPIVGRLSDGIKRRKPFMVYTALIGVVATALVIFMPTQNQIALMTLFFFVGFAISGQSLSFTVILEHSPKKLRSTALGVNNAAAMLVAALVPILIGAIIQSHQLGKVMSEAAIVQGLSLVPFLLGFAFLIALFGIKETFCRQQHEVHELQNHEDFLG